MQELPLQNSSVSVSGMGGSYIEIELDRDITNPADFRDELSAIRKAQESDIVHIRVTTMGGSLETGIAFLAAMRQTQAHIITEVVGSANSCGSLIFLSGDEFRINDHTELMIHTSSFGYAGKSNNVSEYVSFQQEAITKLMYDVYKHFLTDEEIELALSGKDYWFHSEQVAERLQLRKEAYVLEDVAELDTEKEVMSQWPKEQLLSFLFDEDYDESSWVDLEENTEEQYLDMLKATADDNGIKYSWNIGTEKLYDKVKHLLTVD